MRSLAAPRPPHDTLTNLKHPCYIALLQREKTNIEKLLQLIKYLWKEKGVNIVSDGWSDSQRRPPINFLAVDEGGLMFQTSTDCSGGTKDKYFVCNLLKDVINEVG